MRMRFCAPNESRTLCNSSKRLTTLRFDLVSRTAERWDPLKRALIRALRGQDELMEPDYGCVLQMIWIHDFSEWNSILVVFHYDLDPGFFGVELDFGHALHWFGSMTFRVELDSWSCFTMIWIHDFSGWNPILVVFYIDLDPWPSDSPVDRRILRMKNEHSKHRERAENRLCRHEMVCVDLRRNEIEQRVEIRLFLGIWFFLEIWFFQLSTLIENWPGFICSLEMDSLFRGHGKEEGLRPYI